jgi:WD40 repeat protein
LASGSDDKTVRVWDAATGKERMALRGHTSLVRGVAFSPDGKRLASGGWDSTVRIWDTGTGKERLALAVPDERVVWAVAFSPDGRTLAGSCGWDTTVRLWDATTGKEVAILVGHTSPVNSVVFSPDGKAVATGSSDGTIMLWDLTPRGGRDQ